MGPKESVEESEGRSCVLIFAPAALSLCVGGGRGLENVEAKLGVCDGPNCPLSTDFSAFYCRFVPSPNSWT